MKIREFRKIFSGFWSCVCFTEKYIVKISQDACFPILWLASWDSHVGWLPLNQYSRSISGRPPWGDNCLSWETVTCARSPGRKWINCPLYIKSQTRKCKGDYVSKFGHYGLIWDTDLTHYIVADPAKGVDRKYKFKCLDNANKGYRQNYYVVMPL